MVRVANATADPAVTDDIADGYAIGSLWVNTTDDTIWVCVDNVVGAASWVDVTGTGGGEVDPGDVEVVTGGLLMANALVTGSFTVIGDATVLANGVRSNHSVGAGFDITTI